MVKSGWHYSYGLGFWGANGHDGIWHISLAESLSQWSFRMPIFSGFQIQNYHIGYDLVLAILNKVTFIPISNLYFQILPPIFAFTIGILVYRFILDWRHSEEAALWSTFFVYFGGGFGYLIGKGESAFWSQQAISTLINPPFAMSLIFILLGLVLVQKKKYFWASVCFGFLIEIKIYAGLLVLGGLFIASAMGWFKYKKFEYLKIFSISLFISVILFICFERGSQSLIVFQPFWFLETLMGLADRLNWVKFYSAMLTYRTGRVWIKMSAAYFTALLIFILGNFGTRILFIFQKTDLDELNSFIYSIIAAGIIIPMFFLQKGTPWNTIQFFYYSLFFGSILVGVFLGQFLEKSKLKTLLLYSIKVAVILLTIPTSILTLKDVYIPTRPPAMLSNDELSALTFLSKEPPGVVLTQPFNQTKADTAIPNPPRPLYLYSSTAYVSAFSDHQTFLEDEENLDITGYNWQSRKSKEISWVNEKNDSLKRNFLVRNNIKYIYWIKSKEPLLDFRKLGLKRMFENNLVVIYATI